MNNRQNFQDRFSDYLSRRLNQIEAQNIVYGSQKQSNNFLSPNINHSFRKSNYSEKSQSEQSIDSSALLSSISKQSQRRSNGSNMKTASMRKNKLRKVKQIQQNVCSICLEHYKNRADMSCGHSYCYQCLEEWLKTSSRCPYCRSDCPFYRLNGKKYEIEKRQYEHQPIEIDDGLDYECYMCENTNEGDQVLVCDGCGLYACHMRCDPRLRGVMPAEDDQWYCHFC